MPHRRWRHEPWMSRESHQMTAPRHEQALATPHHPLCAAFAPACADSSGPHREVNMQSISDTMQPRSYMLASERCPAETNHGTVP